MTIAIVGATGAVGRTFLEVLAERDFPADEVRLFASARSAGTRLPFRGREIEVEDLETADPAGIAIAFFSAGSSVSKAHAARFAAAGAAVVDNTSAFRLDPDVPLVVPEVNAEAISRRPKGIVANPNCSTILLVVPLAPLHRAFGVRRVEVATYQAASGAGAKALAALEEETRAVLAGNPPTPTLFPDPLAFNCFPHNSAVGEDGFNEEERKMRLETKKILDPAVEVVATCVRVPVHRAHCEAVFATLARPATAAEVAGVLARAPGVRVLDDPETRTYPTPLRASGQDEVLVGRIRQDPADPCRVLFFLAGDQLRKGAATNAVQIAERILAETGAAPCHAAPRAAS